LCPTLLASLNIATHIDHGEVGDLQDHKWVDASGKKIPKSRLDLIDSIVKDRKVEFAGRGKPGKEECQPTSDGGKARSRADAPFEAGQISGFSSGPKLGQETEEDNLTEHEREQLGAAMRLETKRGTLPRRTHRYILTLRAN
jgi:hypothetical protein